MNWFCKFGLHRWSLWSEPKAGTVTYLPFMRSAVEQATWLQARICPKCGKQELRQAC